MRSTSECLTVSNEIKRNGRRFISFTQPRLTGRSKVSTGSKVGAIVVNWMRPAANSRLAPPSQTLHRHPRWQCCLLQLLTNCCDASPHQFLDLLPAILVQPIYYTKAARRVMCDVIQTRILGRIYTWHNVERPNIVYLKYRPATSRQPDSRHCIQQVWQNQWTISSSAD